MYNFFALLHLEQVLVHVVTIMYLSIVIISWRNPLRPFLMNMMIHDDDLLKSPFEETLFLLLLGAGALGPSGHSF